MGMATDLATLNACDRGSFLAALGGIFENAPWVAEAAFAMRPFAMVADLHAAMMQAMANVGETERLALMRGHPELASKVASAGAMTAESRREQGSLGLDRLSEGELARFDRLNAAYRARFGFPFIVCVRRHTRDSLLDNFERRLANSPESERAMALQEIGHIARLRLVEAVEGPGKPKTDGRLSTHVLDTVSGKPAGGVRVVLIELGASATGLLTEAVTMPTAARTSPCWPARRCASAPTRSPSTSAPISPPRGSPPQARRFSTWCRSASPSPSPRGTTTCRCWQAPGATRPIGAARSALTACSPQDCPISSAMKAFNAGAHLSPSRPLARCPSSLSISV
jgi:2-oxo-4-hydroxy-4-carboxy-5-ureidoimidazoline decarboxylase